MLTVKPTIICFVHGESKSKERRHKMQINRGTNGEILLFFPKSEKLAALQILKALYTVSKLSFIRECIEDIEVEMRPKLTLVSHFHYCKSCCMEIDDRVGDNFIKITHDGDTLWVHRNCPPLKDVRPE
jgi:hypothetical protein